MKYPHFHPSSALTASPGWGLASADPRHQDKGIRVSLAALFEQVDERAIHQKGIGAGGGSLRKPALPPLALPAISKTVVKFTDCGGGGMVRLGNAGAQQQGGASHLRQKRAGQTARVGKL